MVIGIVLELYYRFTDQSWFRWYLSCPSTKTEENENFITFSFIYNDAIEKILIEVVIR